MASQAWAEGPVNVILISHALYVFLLQLFPGLISEVAPSDKFHRSRASNTFLLAGAIGFGYTLYAPLAK
jgi:hypothetical protein